MPKRIATVDSPVGVLFRRVARNLMIVGIFATISVGLAHFNAVLPQPGAAPELSDPPGSGVIIRSEVVELWLPETLVDLARDELPALVAQTHQELKKALGRRGQENLWYAITVRGHQVNNETSNLTFVRCPYRQPESIRELMDILAIVAGDPSRVTSADYADAVVHIMPAGMSCQEWLETTQPSSLMRQAVSNELEAAHRAAPDRRTSPSK